MELIPGLPDDIARECLIRIPYKHFCRGWAVCRKWKSEIESVEFHKQRKTTGLSRNVIVLTQAEPTGDTGPDKHSPMPVYQLTLCEPETGVWERLPPLPGYSNGVPLFCQCADVDRYLVVIGGWEPANWEVSNAVHVYDFISATWKRGADMPGPSRSFFGCASDTDNMTVFVAGGHDEEKNALRSAMAYDVARDVWVTLPDMARERDECKGVFYAGKFHVIGGYCSDRQGRFEGSIETFDVALWQWDPVKVDVLRAGLCPRTCVADRDGKMYTFVGDRVEVSDGATWKSVVELPSDVRVGTTAVTWNDKAMVIGSTAYGGPNSCYVLEGGKWTKAECPEDFSGHVQSGCFLQI